MRRFRNAQSLEQEISKLLHYCKNNAVTMHEISCLQRNAYKNCMAAVQKAPCSLTYFFHQIDMGLSLALLDCGEETGTYTQAALWGVLYAVMQEAGRVVQQQLQAENEPFTIATKLCDDGIVFSIGVRERTRLSPLEALLGEDAF